jgi:TolB-like protein/Tfp pilus assembly protein PilF
VIGLRLALVKITLGIYQKRAKGYEMRCARWLGLPIVGLCISAHAAPTATVAVDVDGPVAVGRLAVEVAFERRMDSQNEPRLRLQPGGAMPIEGSWAENGQTYTAIFEITAESPNGDVEVRVTNGTDVDGDRMEDARSATFVIDTHPPDVDGASIEVAGGALYSRQATFAVVPVGFSDRISGISAYYVSTQVGVEGARFENETTHTATEQGLVRLYVWAEDAAGNMSVAVSQTVIVDAEPPTVISANLDPTGVVGAGQIRVDLAFSEALAQDVATRIGLGPLDADGDWTDDTHWTGTVHLGAGIDDGEHALVVEGGQDAAGHRLVAYRGPSLIVDRTPPDAATAHLEIDGGAEVSGDRRLDLAFDGFEDAGVIRTYYGFQDQSATGGGIASDDSRTGVLEEAPVGVNKVFVWAVDEAGNVSAAVSARILVDTQRPAVDDSQVGPPSATRAGALPIVLRFNRAMDFTAEPTITLGDLEVPGGWVPDDSLTWKGLLEIDPATPVGPVELVVAGALDRVGHTMREAYRRPVTVPGDAVFLYGMGRAEADDVIAAEGAFSRILKAESDHVEARYELAMLYGAQGRVEEQLAELEQAVRIDPYLPKAHYALAGIYSDRGQLADAERSLEKVVAIEEGGTGTGSPYARPNRDLMQLQFAPFEMVRAPQPTQANVLHQSGVVAARSGDLTTAAERLQKAIDAGAGAEARYNLGTVYLHQGLWPEAEEELEDALKDGVQPANSVRINLGAAQIARGRTREAEKTYEPIGALPEAIFMNDLAVLQAKRGRADEALNTLAGLSATDAGVLTGRGAILLQTDRLPEAEAAFMQALTLDPTHADAHLGLGGVREAQGDAAGAREAYRAAIAIRLEYVDAHFRLGQVLLDLGDPEGGAVEFQRALDIAPDFAEARAALGTAYGQQGLEDKATAQYQKAAEAKRKSWSERPKGMKVALLRFENRTGDTDLDYLRTGLPEALSADLLQISDFDLVERLQIEQLRRERSLNEAGAFEQTAQEMGQLIQAEAIVTGGYMLADKRLTLTAKMVSVTGTVMGSVTVTGKKKRVVELGRELAVELAHTTGALIDPELQQEMLKRQAPSEEAFRLAAQAREAFYAGDEEAAQALTAQALAADAASLDMVAGIDLIDDAARQGKTVAVVAFENLQQTPATAWLAQGIPDALSSDLSKIAGLYLVERRQILALQEERGLVELGEVEGNEMGQMLGAGVTLIGSYTVVDDRVTITARMLSSEQGSVIISVSTQGKMKKLVEATGQLAIDLSAALEVEVSRAERALIENQPPEAVDALRQLVELREMQAADVEGQMVAVKPFRNARGVARHDWLSGSLAEGLSTELIRRGLPLVERAQLNQLYDEQLLIEAGEVQGMDAAGALGARKLGARYLVVGSYTAQGRKKVRVDSRLLDTSTEAVLAAASAAGSSEKLTSLQEELVDAYLAAMDPEETGDRDGGDDHRLFRLPTRWLVALAITSGAGWGGTHYMFEQAEEDYLAGGDNYDDTNRYYRSRRGLKTSTQILASSIVFSWLWNHTVAR